MEPSDFSRTPGSAQLRVRGDGLGLGFGLFWEQDAPRGNGRARRGARRRVEVGEHELGALSEGLVVGGLQLRGRLGADRRLLAVGLAQPRDRAGGHADARGPGQYTALLDVARLEAGSLNANVENSISMDAAPRPYDVCRSAYGPARCGGSLLLPGCCCWRAARQAACRRRPPPAAWLAACVCSGRRPCWRLTATLAAPPTTQRRDVSLMTITNTAAGLLLPRRGGPSALL
jgi:hypothetical protein